MIKGKGAPGVLEHDLERRWKAQRDGEPSPGDPDPAMAPMPAPRSKVRWAPISKIEVAWWVQNYNEFVAAWRRDYGLQWANGRTLSHFYGPRVLAFDPVTGGPTIALCFDRFKPGDRTGADMARLRWAGRVIS